MAKKTKKEKILASYRRKLRLLNEVGKKEEKIVKSISQEKNQEKEENQLDKTNTKDLSLKKYFISDFKKSILINFFIIAFLFVLYLTKIIK